MILHSDDDYPIPNWENEIVNFPDTHPMSHTLRDLYDKGGQSAIYDYVLENHTDWAWTFCEACDCHSPIWETENYYLCAVCWSVLEIEEI